MVTFYDKSACVDTKNQGLEAALDSGDTTTLVSYFYTLCVRQCAYMKTSVEYDILMDAVLYCVDHKVPSMLKRRNAGAHVSLGYALAACKSCLLHALYEKKMRNKHFLRLGDDEFQRELERWDADTCDANQHPSDAFEDASWSR